MDRDGDGRVSIKERRAGTEPRRLFLGKRIHLV